MDLDTERIKKSKIRKGYESWCWGWIWERAALRDSKCAVNIRCLLLFYKVNTLNSQYTWDEMREIGFLFLFLNGIGRRLLYYLFIDCLLLAHRFFFSNSTITFLLSTPLAYIISKKEKWPKLPYRSVIVWVFSLYVSLVLTKVKSFCK